jgi:hypothetical protein
MLAREGVLGLVMVEFLVIERDKLEVAALVFRVAGLTLDGVGLAVEAAPLGEVDFDFLMARDTFCAERLAERRMAIETTLLHLGVRLGNLSRHHAFEEADGLGKRGPQRGNENDEEKALDETAEGQGHIGSE